MVIEPKKAILKVITILLHSLDLNSDKDSSKEEGEEGDEGKQPDNLEDRFQEIGSFYCDSNFFLDSLEEEGLEVNQ